MNILNLIRVGFLLTGLILVVAEVWLVRRRKKPIQPAAIFLAVCSVLFIMFNIYLWINHINFPLHLDLMEGVVWQHFQRAANGLLVYPEPTPEFVPLAYNVLYYYLAVPFSWLLGVNLLTLRLVSILGMMGCAWVLYQVVRQKSGSRWWGLMALGVFAAAYRVMDAYLDTAHSDSWLLFSVLMGSYLIYKDRSRLQNLLGVLWLVAAFWFKQHGALFVIGGVLYLTWREGLRRSWPYWLTAGLLGPVAYLFAGPSLFGPRFIYFTWEVPRNWSEVNFATFRRFAGFILKSYPLLGLVSGLHWLRKVWRERPRLKIWDFQLVFAVLAGLMGSLDAGSSQNVYIPMGMWFILCGMLGLHAATVKIQALGNYRLQYVMLLVTLAVLLFNPLSVLIPANAQIAYADLLVELRNLDGPVYAPTLGQLSRDYQFYPAAHWVALEDMIRGPGIDTRNHPNTRQLLKPALDPQGPAYILAHIPLEAYPWMEFLLEDYSLVVDYEERFSPLRSLPKRFEHGWPRYLYRYTGGN